RLDRPAGHGHGRVPGHLPAGGPDVPRLLLARERRGWRARSASGAGSGLVRDGARAAVLRRRARLRAGRRLSPQPARVALLLRARRVARHGRPRGRGACRALRLGGTAGRRRHALRVRPRPPVRALAGSLLLALASVVATLVAGEAVLRAGRREPRI